MIWKRLRKSTPKEEEAFSDRMEASGVTWKDRLLMILTAYAVILVPCALILIAISLVVLLLFGAL